MEVILDGVSYKVNIIKKDNKNTYVRVKNDLEIYVTTSYLTTNNYITGIIRENAESIRKMIEREKKKIEKKGKFYLLGKKYDIILSNSFTTPIIDEEKVYTKSLEDLEKLGRNYAEEVFNERLKACYEHMKNAYIKYPHLRIRKMKAKWGHCNKKECVITLNLELIKYDIDDIDYVIIHELCHLIHFNHSKEFWYEVSRYKPNYKKNRKNLKEE